MKQYRVLIDCPDEKGLVYKISSVFFKYDLNILSNSEFVDAQKNCFFMRSVVEGYIDGDDLKNDLRSVLPKEAVLRIIAPVLTQGELQHSLPADPVVHR
jgi:formyltetrahydrofolate deformylase